MYIIFVRHVFFVFHLVAKIDGLYNLVFCGSNTLLLAAAKCLSTCYSFYDYSNNTGLAISSSMM